MEFRFKQENRDVAQRRQNCEKIRQQFPDKIPIICEKDPKSKINVLNKNLERQTLLQKNELYVPLRNGLELLITEITLTNKIKEILKVFHFLLMNYSLLLNALFFLIL